jgi:HSP20 family protein
LQRTSNPVDRFSAWRDNRLRVNSVPRKEQSEMLMRTDPFRELDRVAQQMLGSANRPAAMPIDAFRQGEEFVVQFDLPGVSGDSIDLTVERNVLTVHAQRARSFREEDVELLVGERPHGVFSRQLFLGDTLDAENLKAEYTDGVLVLRIPVREQAKARKIPIDSGQSRKGGAAIDASSQSEPDAVGAARS